MGIDVSGYTGIRPGFTGLNYATNSGDFLIEVAKGNISGHSLVFKYGSNPDIDAGTDPEEVWTYGGTYTYPTSAAINYISSSDNSDTQTIVVEGLDADYNPQSITVTLAGNTKTQIGTGETWLRVYRAYNSDSTEFAGTVYIYEDDTTTTPGVPDTPSKVKAQILPLDQQTYMALWTVPAGHTAFFLGGAISITTGASAAKAAFVELRFRLENKVFRSAELIGIASTGSSTFSQDLHALGPVSFPEKTDIQARVREVTANDTGVSAYFSILLIENEYLNI